MKTRILLLSIAIVLLLPQHSSALATYPFYLKMGQSNVIPLALSDGFMARLVELRGEGYQAVVINCGVGHTSIYDWRQDGDLFNACMYKAHQEMQSGGRLAGIIFSQGEYNAHSCENAGDWHERFEAIVNAARAHVYKPDAPVVLMQLGEKEPDYPCWGQIKNRQMLAGDFYKVYVMNTMDIPRLNGIHYDTAGYIALGRKLASRINPYLNP